MRPAPDRNPQCQPNPTRRWVVVPPPSSASSISRTEAFFGGVSRVEIATPSIVDMPNLPVARIIQPGEVAMTHPKVTLFSLLMLGALSISTAVVSADATFGNPAGTLGTTDTKGRPSVVADHAAPPSRSTTTVAFASRSAQFGSAAAARQFRMPTVTPPAGAPLDAGLAVIEPRECDRQQGIDSNCIFH